MTNPKSSDLYVGKHLWYRARAHEAGPYAGTEPLAAIVAKVMEGNRVNLLVVGAEGTLHSVKDVLYYQGEDRPATPGYAEPQNAPSLPERTQFVGEFVSADFAERKPEESAPVSRRPRKGR